MARSRPKQAIIEPAGPPAEGTPPASLARRLGWFFALWLAGLLVTAAVAYALRAMIL